MIDFLSSLSILGWLLIGLAGFTLWQMPTILRMMWRILSTGAGSAVRRERMPGDHTSLPDRKDRR
ncbi:hypothetical protein [Pseudaestuariivita atlantica]|uniref:Cellulose biosynthesis protein BcsF n=1 Tax=Pseudaestuariivita atlantica TaxID=1317121 RepID=A0A0L1JLQ4_9RHOB|nr:hypothetical protein [Pseudaestuariivita atlantica]KNG92338.1 hypothetical protein ATO11_17105 [Pseudaestuariivita atlantica]